jgi:phosphoribosylaminoimidazolecarboxamide formyltransferase/IMP cyclohydrolase
VSEATGQVAGASFKHVSPAGTAVAGDLDEADLKLYGLHEGPASPVARAYVRARSADPKSSYADMAAVSKCVDVPTAEFLAGVVSDGIIAPEYDPEALRILRTKKRGSYLIFQIDPDFSPPTRETREVFGLRLSQERNAREITEADLQDVVCGELTDRARADLLLALITIKYTQSNSVGYAGQGRMVGIGAGQQSRIDCTKLAGAKARLWHLLRHPRVLTLAFKDDIRVQDRINWRVRFCEGDLTSTESGTFEQALREPVEPLRDDERAEWNSRLRGLSFASDGLIPFRDNVDWAYRYGAEFIAEPGGSIRSDEVETACRQYGITLIRTALRLFHH